MNYGLLSFSMAQALGVWSDLCDAYHGKNGYGGDTAEIYLYRFMPDCPTVSVGRGMGKPLTGIAADEERRRVKAANGALWALLSHFAEERTCEVRVEGQPLGAWVATAGFDHRVHVTVRPK